MTIHTITAIATASNGVTADAVAGPDGTVDVIDLLPGDRIGVVTSLDAILGVTLDIVSGAPGDLLAVTGAVGRIPDYQVGALLVADEDGVFHFAGAGAIADAITRVQS